METTITNFKSDTYSKLTDDLLLQVQKPAQYLGMEWGALLNNTKKTKTWENTKVHFSILYPDIYELGLANFGIKILYKTINSHPHFLCDRAYAPMKDMENLLRKEKTFLWGWETFKPLKDFDLLGISLSYELSYTNVLNTLELSGLELLSKDRTSIFPLVFAGGPTTFNPEPMADFFDFFIIGDGEEVLLEIGELIKNCKEELKEENLNKESVLLRLANIPGVYVPRFYDVDPSENYLPKKNNLYNVPEKITKRVVSIGDYNHPTGELVPYLATVHDRQVLEIRRGCDRGCRFCQPGYVYLPVRERTPENLVDISKEALKKTGYDEYSLLSLSASDYTKLHDVAMKLNTEHKEKGISLSMPSQRADRFDMTIANEINTVRKSGITLAPEAGTERLREVINKGLKEKDIKNAIENVYDAGYHQVKLYFMIGLPTETYEDLDGIIALLKWMSDLSREKKKRPLNITCTISTFVPKSFTPFQWVSQNSGKEFKEKNNYLRNKIKESRLRNVKLNCTDPDIALLEVALSRGDRRFGKVILNAFKSGAKFDAWSESLNIERWKEAAKLENIDLDFEATKKRELGEICPWEIIDSGLLKKFLIEEAKKAFKEIETEACTENTCHACGVCFDLNVLNEVSKNLSKGNKYVKEIGEEKIDKGPEIKNQTSNLSPTNSQQKHNLPVITIQKYEIIHTKTGNMKFISHLDLQRLFERALRRAEIPVSFTEGFNPKPKMQWLMPLPLYYESNSEILHLQLSKALENNELIYKLNNELPPEIQLKSADLIPNTSKLSTPENVNILYKILTFSPTLWEKDICELNIAIENFLARDSFLIKIFKKNQDRNNQNKFVQKEVEIRSCVNGIKVLSIDGFQIHIDLVGSTRPELVLNQIVPPKFFIQPESLQDEWQKKWKISKELVRSK